MQLGKKRKLRLATRPSYLVWWIVKPSFCRNKSTNLFFSFWCLLQVSKEAVLLVIVTKYLHQRLPAVKRLSPAPRVLPNAGFDFQLTSWGILDVYLMLFTVKLPQSSEAACMVSSCITGFTPKNWTPYNWSDVYSSFPQAQQIGKVFLPSPFLF